MLGIGKILSSEKKKNAGGDHDVYLYQATLTAPNDPQTLENVHQVGVQSRAPANSLSFWGKVKETWKICLGIDDKVPKETLEEGERIAYSSDGGVIKGFIKYLKTGILHVNGDADFAVRFTALETAYNQLKSDHDALLSVVDLHTHGGVSTGSSSTGTLVTGLLPSTGNIAPAKVPTVKLP